MLSPYTSLLSCDYVNPIRQVSQSGYQERFFRNIVNGKASDFFARHIGKENSHGTGKAV